MNEIPTHSFNLPARSNGLCETKALYSALALGEDAQGERPFGKAAKMHTRTLSLWRFGPHLSLILAHLGWQTTNRRVSATRKKVRDAQTLHAVLAPTCAHCITRCKP